eukprot:CAMPEP_0119119018 /NCGR_PEP_ID=MMETSP1310-20130426/697_1 /TAXON_ID=464262 /ORGANISM="Genus nov. species nov., Strain RCC2339" /LENGTH=275 /DNA_ID=CAMNT_0007108429 /DNA_START=73 /DNA_END=900 /DNA_ORIENTATION=-
MAYLKGLGLLVLVALAGVVPVMCQDSEDNYGGDSGRQMDVEDHDDFQDEEEDNEPRFDVESMDDATEIEYEGDLDEEVQEAAKYVKLNPDFVETSYFFLQEETGVVKVGAVNEVLMGLTNFYESAINVSAIRISIMHPSEPQRFYLQNCTAVTYFETVESGATRTFSYKYMPDALLHPGEYVLNAQVYFEADDDVYMAQFYNSSMSFEEEDRDVDTQLLSIVLMGIGVLVALLYILSSFFSGKKSRRGQRKAQEISEVDEEWIPKRLRSSAGKRR